MDTLSRFAKASEDEQLWESMVAFADNILQPALRDAFIAAVLQLRRHARGPEFVRLVGNGDAAAAIHRLIEAMAYEPLATFEQAMIRATERAAQEAARRASAEFVFAFDPAPAEIAAIVRARGAELVREMTDELRVVIRAAVQRGITLGHGPAEIAREIRTAIGLTQRQLNSVRNYRALLERGSTLALRRALRDARFDRTVRAIVEGRRKWRRGEVDKIVARYHARMLRYRATTIARTESINALYMGQRAAWQQAVNTGAIRQNQLRRFWYVARDERTCAICKPIPRMNPDGVEFDQPFLTPSGNRMGPTMHPDCRCTVFIRVLISYLEDVA